MLESAAHHVLAGRRTDGHDHKNGHRSAVNGALCPSWRARRGEGHGQQQIIYVLPPAPRNVLEPQHARALLEFFFDRSRKRSSAFTLTGLVVLACVTGVPLSLDNVLDVVSHQAPATVLAT